MKKRVKDMWVKALRSRKYKQGKNKLKDQNGNFCCLGVLCDLHAQETGGTWSSNGWYIKYKGAQLLLPKQVVDWAGLVAKDGQPKKKDLYFITKDGKTTSLADMNDGNKGPSLSFRKIADIIEKYL